MDTGGKGKVPITLGLLGNITNVHKVCLTYVDAYTTPLSLAMAISKYKQSAGLVTAMAISGSLNFLFKKK